MVGSIMLIYIWEFRSYGSGGELCCRNSPLSPPRCLARGSDPLGASSPWDLAPESLSPTGQGLGTAAAPGMSATTDPRLRERHLRCPQCCGKLKCRPKPRPPAFPQQHLWWTDTQPHTTSLRHSPKLQLLGIDGIRSGRTSCDELWPKGIRCTIYRVCGKKYPVRLDRHKFENYYETRTNHNNRQSGAAAGV
jgi:hypothetical protein